MAHKQEKTIIQMLLGLLGKIVSLILMVAVVSLNVWVMKNLYFPTTYAKAKVEDVSETRKRLNVEDARQKDLERRMHFHGEIGYDTSIDVEMRQPPLCLRCHGNYPHSKSAEIRSLCNMHTYFLACEVCHIRPKKGEVFSYRWFDNITGEAKLVLEGSSKGNYGAKIIARIMDEKTGQYRRLDRPLNEAFALDFIQRQQSYTMEEQAKAKARIHEELSKDPILCNECHHEKQIILNFDDLDYSKERAQQLRGTEVAGMVGKYVEFYLPTMFDADMQRKQKADKLDAPKRISYEESK